ncbi:hypothetical protein [Sorangium sp. So ce1024]|uniref:hypothetical protein n=1 Tax=Sorangium sp. So ce1024 TaxID=3133327 RepID=UPI003EFC013B
MTSAIGIAALDLSAESLPFIERKFAGRVSRPEDVAAAEVSLRVGSASFALPSGRYGAWEVLLNTCLVLGSDPLCFLARMHAQCEIHAWVDGPDRAWLAGIIDEGRRVGLMRDGQGWDDVTALLRARSDEPVVMSYSVCDQFPSRSVANWTPPADEDGEPNRDAWYDLDEAERWRLAMDGVQELRFGPETLRTSFGHCKSALDIKREIHEATR